MVVSSVNLFLDVRGGCVPFYFYNCTRTFNFSPNSCFVFASFFCRTTSIRLRLREGPPIELIRDIITVCPHLITQCTQNDGTTPLHFLFFIFKHRISENLRNDVQVEEIADIARLLIETDPMVLRIKDINGWLPIHTLFFYGKTLPIQPEWPEWLVSNIIAPYPESIATENRGGVTPFQAFWDNYAFDSHGRCVLNPEDISKLYYNEIGVRGIRGSTCTCRQKLTVWECMLVMIRCSEEASTDTDAYAYTHAHARTRVDGDQIHAFMPLHAISSSALTTPRMMSLGAQIHRRELNRMDSGGNLPLHCACKQGRMQNAEILVGKNPHAARVPNSDGFLPLFLALGNGVSSWDEHHGLKELVLANPDALFEKDPAHHVYPFIISASLVAGSCEYARCEALNCLFQIIQLCPELIPTECKPMRHDED